MRFIKLMYLSDRKAMELYGFPISGDHYFSMNKADPFYRRHILWLRMEVKTSTVRGNHGYLM